MKIENKILTKESVSIICYIFEFPMSKIIGDTTKETKIHKDTREIYE